MLIILFVGESDSEWVFKRLLSLFPNLIHLKNVFGKENKPKQVIKTIELYYTHVQIPRERERERVDLKSRCFAKPFRTLLLNLKHKPSSRVFDTDQLTSKSWKSSESMREFNIELKEMANLKVCCNNHNMLNIFRPWNEQKLYVPWKWMNWKSQDIFNSINKVSPFEKREGTY